MAKNDNKKFANSGPGSYLPRCRFDRVLLNRQWLALDGGSGPEEPSGVDGLVERWELLGTERLTCGVFPSDHFGISTLIRLPPAARPGAVPLVPPLSAGAGATSSSSSGSTAADAATVVVGAGGAGEEDDEVIVVG
jgi:hypothetical protein